MRLTDQSIRFGSSKCILPYLGHLAEDFVMTVTRADYVIRAKASNKAQVARILGACIQGQNPSQLSELLINTDKDSKIESKPLN